jgi:HD-GYP domain-containing protein (c-di-GMP phosphodiesterase class II)
MSKFKKIVNYSEEIKREMEAANILIISRDRKLKNNLHQELSDKKCNLFFLDKINKIEDTIEEKPPDIIILDQGKKEFQEVLACLENLKKREPLIIKILLYSEKIAEKELILYMNQGIIHKFFPRDFSASQIKQGILSCLQFLHPVKSFQSQISLLKTRLKDLNEIGISLSSEHDLSVLLDKILREARKITNSEAGSLYIIKDNKLSFEVTQNDYIDRRDGSDKDTFQSFTLPLSTQSIAGYVALTGELLNIEDAYKIPMDCPYSFNIEVDKKTGYRCKSMLVVPMKNEKDEIIGVLQLINSLDTQGRITIYDKDDEQVVLSLASQAAVSICNTFLIIEIKRLLSSLVEYSSSLIDARSRHTAGHSQRVALYTMEIAKSINRQREGPFGSIKFTSEEIEELRFSAFLHDIGKIGVPEMILDKKNKLSDEYIELIRHRFDLIKALYQSSYLRNKAGMRPLSGMAMHSEEELKKKKAEIDLDFEVISKMNIPGAYTDGDAKRIQQIAEKKYTDLDGNIKNYLTPEEVKNLAILQGNLTDQEREEIKNHINHTINILSKIPFPADLKNVPFIAGTHHERLNGSGYPKGLNSRDLSLQCRILALVDFYEALTAPDRPYRKPLSREEALSILKEEVYRDHCDQNLVELIEKENLLRL